MGSYVCQHCKLNRQTLSNLLSTIFWSYSKGSIMIMFPYWTEFARLRSMMWMFFVMLAITPHLFADTLLCYRSFNKPKRESLRPVHLFMSHCPNSLTSTSSFNHHVIILPSLHSLINTSSHNKRQISDHDSFIHFHWPSHRWCYSIRTILQIKRSFDQISKAPNLVAHSTFLLHITSWLWSCALSCPFLEPFDYTIALTEMLT